MESNFIKRVELIAEFNSYEEFNESEYSELPSISVSKLKKLKKSPLHYKEEEYEEKKEFDFGKASNAMILVYQSMIKSLVQCRFKKIRLGVFRGEYFRDVLRSGAMKLEV